MSHAPYQFLIDFEGLENEEEIKEHAVSKLTDFAAKHFDENNWYQEEVLVLRDGRVFQMCPVGDWRGRDTLYDVYAEMSQEDRWDRVTALAAACVAYDLDIEANEKMESMSDILARIAEEMPRKLAAAYLSIAGKSRKESEQENWSSEYDRFKQAPAFELVRRSYLTPFTNYPATPYDYRCFDLTGDSEFKDTHGILIVDIHT